MRADQGPGNTAPGRGQSMRAGEAMDLLLGSERRARQSLQPPALKLGIGLCILGGGIFLLPGSAGLRHLPSWDGVHLSALAMWVGAALFLFGSYTTRGVRVDSAWGVAVNRRSPIGLLSLAAGVAFVATMAFATKAGVAPVLRWGLPILTGALSTAVLELARRQIAATVTSVVAVSAVVWVCLLLMAWNSHVGQLTISVCAMGIGIYLLLRAIRDQWWPAATQAND